MVQPIVSPIVWVARAHGPSNICTQNVIFKNLQQVRTSVAVASIANNPAAEAESCDLAIR